MNEWKGKVHRWGIIEPTKIIPNSTSYQKGGRTRVLCNQTLNIILRKHSSAVLCQ